MSTALRLCGGHRNAWLETMDKFGQFIGEREVASGEEVRVAIIDDGVDHMQPDIKGYVHEGVSFYTERESFHKHSNSVPNPWYPFYFSSQGHGTLMAQLVLRVCPMAQLYIARLNQGYSTSGKLQPTAESAAKVSPRASAYPGRLRANRQPTRRSAGRSRARYT